ncbi:MAG: hypothetical protein HY235_04915 [Acidobacteria bacterium]|nr:hypothetical protein [Acidobacteriota bacterium]
MLLLVVLFAVCAFAQPPSPVKFSAFNTELSYLHAPGEPTGLLIVLPAQPENAKEEWAAWSPVAASRKWRLAMPLFPVAGDPGVKALEALVSDVRTRFAIPKTPAYLAGAGPAAASVFYSACRASYLWTAALAIGGTPKPAVDSDRLFAANTANLPVAWALSAEEKSAVEQFRHRLLSAGFNLHVMEAPTTSAALDFLAAHNYEPFPRKVDCETGNPALARCYWITPSAFDPNLHNDALRSSRVSPDIQASLDLGGFGYQLTRPGPGVLVEWLPPNYGGPLQLNDRIVALSGKPIADPRHYVELMREVTEEKPVAITIERNKERIRLTTRYQLRKREEVLTARLQAEFNPESKEITVVSRAIAAIHITVPPQWVPATLNWNGTPIATFENPGCMVLSVKDPGTARPCPAVP